MSLPSYYKNIQGWFDFEDVYELATNRIESDQKAVFVEVGSWMGCSTCYLAEYIRSQDKDSDIKVYAVDTWQGSVNEQQHLDLVAAHGGTIKQVFESHMQDAGVDHIITPMEMTSLEAAAQFVDESIDFVYIDANHRYEDVCDDIKAWLPKVKDGGLIGGHDYAEPSCGVQEAVIDTFGPQPNHLSIGRNSWYHIKIA